MLRNLVLSACLVSALGSSQVFAQSASTTVNINITNNLTSSPIAVQKSSCTDTLTCNIASNSIPARQTGTESVTAATTSGGSLVQVYGGNVGLTNYACNFQTFVDANFSGGCHTFSASASASSGPGGNHPGCNYNLVSQPSGPSCTGGLVTFTITQ